MYLHLKRQCHLHLNTF